VGPAGVAPVRARDAAIREFVAAHYLYLGSGRAAAAAAARDLRPTGAQRRRRPGGGAVRLDWRLIAALPLSQIPWRSAGLMSALAPRSASPTASCAVRDNFRHWVRPTSPTKSAGSLKSGVVNAASIDFETLDNEPIRKGRAAACEF